VLSQYIMGAQEAGSLPAQETRVLLTARKLVQSKLIDIEMSLRGILRGFGLKIGKTNPNRFGLRVEELVAGHPTPARPSR